MVLERWRQSRTNFRRVSGEVPGRRSGLETGDFSPRFGDSCGLHSLARESLYLDIGYPISEKRYRMFRGFGHFRKRGLRPLILTILRRSPKNGMEIMDEIENMISIPFFGERRSEEHTSELQSQSNLVCRLLLEKKKKKR